MTEFNLYASTDPYLWLYLHYNSRIFTFITPLCYINSIKSSPVCSLRESVHPKREWGKSEASSMNDAVTIPVSLYWLPSIGQREDGQPRQQRRNWALQIQAGKVAFPNCVCEYDMLVWLLFWLLLCYWKIFVIGQALMQFVSKFGSVSETKSLAYYLIHLSDQSILVFVLSI